MSRHFLFILFFAALGHAHAGEIKLSGAYLGTNVFVRNPINPANNTFCILNIYVNGKELIGLPPSSAIQIDLSSYNLNDPIEIRVTHKEGCKPAFINPDVLNNFRRFEFLFSQIDDNSINWITTGETPGGYFLLEKMRWKGWQSIDSVSGKGKMDNNQYSLEAEHYSGDNEYRITYTTQTEEYYISEVITFYSLLKSVTFFPTNEVYDVISLSRATDYEIYDEYGKLVAEGFGEYIDVDDLPVDAEYTMIVENEPAQFYKPKPEIIRKPKRKKS